MRKKSFIRDRIITILLLAIIVLLGLGIVNQTRLFGFSLFPSSTGAAEIQSSSTIVISPAISSTTPGTLVQSPTVITIVAEVHGASVSATIDGVKMKTVKDPDYSTSSYIAMGVADVGAASSPEALFSHFVYTPL
jgi:hypothetical protein